jgi:hypothetical protein
MDDDQMAEIVDHLLIAAYELDEAKAAANILADHDKDAASLRDLVIKLNSDLLQHMFQRFPDFLPFDEFPEISSSLRWDQVQLPPTASEEKVDQIILSVVAPHWHKMALIIWKAVKQGQERGLGITDEMFAARIHFLVEAGRIERQGDIRKWRHSEVRLTTEVPATSLN